MAKKRRRAGGTSQDPDPSEPNPAKGKLARLTTFEDIADSEDEFFASRDKILLEDEPNSKRRRLDDGEAWTYFLPP